MEPSPCTPQIDIYMEERLVIIALVESHSTGLAIDGPTVDVFEGPTGSYFQIKTDLKYYQSEGVQLLKHPKIERNCAYNPRGIQWGYVRFLCNYQLCEL